jgi:hypothetical protein
LGFQERPGRSDHPDFDDPSPTRFDQPRLSGGQGASGAGSQGLGNQGFGSDGQGSRAPDQPGQLSPVYQTGMQLVVPPGREWTFRDPGTGAFPGYTQPGNTGSASTGAANTGFANPGPANTEFANTEFANTAFGNPGRGGSGAGTAGPGYPEPGYNQPDFIQRGYGEPGYNQPGYNDSGYREPAFNQPSAYQRAVGEPAPGEAGYGRSARIGPGQRQPGALPAGPLAPSAGPKRSRKTPILIGVGALVVIVGVGAVVVGPKFLKHTDPGCNAYANSALPAYNHAVADLNQQSSQATLAKDLSAAITQLNGAISQAQSASVKAALQDLVTDLTQVQADVQKGTLPASTVSTLNSASAAADGAC